MYGSNYGYNNSYSSLGLGTIIIIFVVVIIIQIIIACFTGSIASGKGRSYAGWFCLSFFLLGIIALIIAACLSDNTAPRRVYYVPRDDSKGWTCKKCSAHNYDGLFCARCGAIKDESNASQSKKTMSTPQVKRTWVCSECKHVNDHTSMQCENCKTPRY